MPDAVQSIDWFAIAAPLILAVSAAVVLLVDAFFGPPRSRRQALIPAALTVVGALASAVPAIMLWGETRATFCIAEPSGLQDLP